MCDINENVRVKQDILAEQDDQRIDVRWVRSIKNDSSASVEKNYYCGQGWKYVGNLDINKFIGMTHL